MREANPLNDGREPIGSAASTGAVGSGAAEPEAKEPEANDPAAKAPHAALERGSERVRRGVTVPGIEPECVRAIDASRGGEVEMRIPEPSRERLGGTHGAQTSTSAAGECRSGSASGKNEDDGEKGGGDDRNPPPEARAPRSSAAGSGCGAPRARVAPASDRPETGSQGTSDASQTSSESSHPPPAEGGAGSLAEEGDKDLASPDAPLLPARAKPERGPTERAEADPADAPPTERAEADPADAPPTERADVGPAELMAERAKEKPAEDAAECNEASSAFAARAEDACAAAVCVERPDPRGLSDGLSAPRGLRRPEPPPNEGPPVSGTTVSRGPRERVLEPAKSAAAAAPPLPPPREDREPELAPEVVSLSEAPALADARGEGPPPPPQDCPEKPPNCGPGADSEDDASPNADLPSRTAFAVAEPGAGPHASSAQSSSPQPMVPRLPSVPPNPAAAAKSPSRAAPWPALASARAPDRGSEGLERDLSVKRPGPSRFRAEPGTRGLDEPPGDAVMDAAWEEEKGGGGGCRPKPAGGREGANKKIKKGTSRLYASRRARRGSIVQATRVMPLQASTKPVATEQSCEEHGVRRSVLAPRRGARGRAAVWPTRRTRTKDRWT